MDNENSKRVNVDYDCVIIGAGISGYTLGYLLKKEGKSVLIIQDEDKKDTLLGGLVLPNSYKLLASIYTDDVAKSLVSKYNKCHGIVSNVDFPIEKVELYTTNQDKLEDMMRKKYEELGGECLYNTDEIRIDHVNKVVHTNKKDGAYKYLVGADGSHSLVRESLGLTPRKFHTAIDLKYAGKINDLIIEFKDNFKGYTWIIPSESNTHFGVMCINQEEFSVAQVEFEKLLKKYNIPSDYAREIKVPTGNNILLKNDDVFLIGEAAGLVSPIIGKGLYLDLFSARALAKALTKGVDYEVLMTGELSTISKELEFSKTVFDVNARKKAVSMVKGDNFITRKLKEQVIKKAMEYISN